MIRLCNENSIYKENRRSSSCKLKEDENHFHSTHMYDSVTLSNRVCTYRQSLWYLYSSHILQTSTQPNTKLPNRLQIRIHNNTLCISIFVFWTCLGDGVNITYMICFIFITSIVTLYNTRNTSIVMLQYRKSSIVYIQYWMYQYRAFTILEYQNRWSMHKVMVWT
jgi:hypothetical protein